MYWDTGMEYPTVCVFVGRGFSSWQQDAAVTSHERTAIMAGQEQPRASVPVFDPWPCTNCCPALPWAGNTVSDSP